MALPLRIKVLYSSIILSIFAQLGWLTRVDALQFSAGVFFVIGVVALSSTVFAIGPRWQRAVVGGGIVLLGYGLANGGYCPRTDITWYLNCILVLGVLACGVHQNARLLGAAGQTEYTTRNPRNVALSWLAALLLACIALTTVFVLTGFGGIGCRSGPQLSDLPEPPRPSARQPIQYSIGEVHDAGANSFLRIKILNPTMSIHTITPTLRCPSIPEITFDVASREIQVREIEYFIMLVSIPESAEEGSHSCTIDAVDATGTAMVPGVEFVLTIS